MGPDQPHQITEPPQGSATLARMPSSSAGGESATFPRMFSSSADEVFKISMSAYLARRPANRLRIGRNVCDN
jgi:hypothetical protein